MSITFKRHFWLLIAFFIVIGLCLWIGSTRIIAYSFGEGSDIEIKGKNYNNDIYLFDDSVMHEIKIGLNKEDYEDMVRTYQETGEKEYFRTYVTIDGITIPDVGIRLKGNLTLRQALGGGMGNGQEGMLPRENGDKNNNNNFPQPPEGFERPEGMEEMRGMRNMRLPQDLEFPDNWEDMTKEEQDSFMQANIVESMPGFGGPKMDLPENWEEITPSPAKAMAGREEEKREYMNKNGNNFRGVMEGNGSNPPYLIKIDEFVAGQTYQGFAEISVRLGSDKSLLSEPVAYSIHEEFGQIVPETAYAIVEASENEPSLYVICEHLDENYTDKHFSDADGALYKAGNFVGFEYRGDDPTFYAESFEQKTNINDDDLAPLIRFLKFVSESSDEEFEDELPNWLDINSFITMMALDNLLSNNDSFIGMGSNYYLFYDKSNEKFTMLSWDMNLAMGGMGGGGMRPDGDNQEMTEGEQKRQEIFKEWLNEGGFGEEGENTLNNKIDSAKKNAPGGIGGGRHGTNKLKERFMANEKFLPMYNERYEELKKSIFGQSWVLEKIDQLSTVFTDYNANHNIINQTDYDSGVTRIKSFVEENK